MPEPSDKDAVNTSSISGQRTQLFTDSVIDDAICTTDSENRIDSELRHARDCLEGALRASEAHRAAADIANRTKNEFISSVSHELRTPLNTIRLWTRILQSGGLSSEKWAQGIRVIERAATAQQQLIEDLLDVSRVESGKLRLVARPTRLVAVIRNAIEALQPLLESRELRVELALDDEIGVVNADPERIQQVMWNLLANAIKFTPDGGRIDVVAAREGDTVAIRVMDTGEGIASELLPSVFERFQQVEAATTRTHGGLGLGLAIAKKLVELHGGTITAASAGRGQGTTFTLSLPLPASDGEERPELIEAPISKADALRGVTVLLVEDDPPTRDAMCRLLQINGAQVRVAGNATQAREAYNAATPDLLICDIGLPSEDGLSLMRWLRGTEQAQHRVRVPAVAVTAFTRADDKHAALDAGFDRHIPKPVDEARLVSVITETLNCRQSRRFSALV